ncbi:MAG TPA: tRNA (N6-isopentenyl adenosine(37)-C2)-methylthiotransferase MiaB [Candidatus Onthoplasma faecigallinarum]|nr:tRNA (N6-isopentenyl adenosine(37)-C2)-methylthiotransferase MiaB [Candidatus Onthoplasma faecigallinarum]
MNSYEGKTYHVVTYGCQMNVHESEKIRGILSTLGMLEIDDIEKADVVVFNTCCIREGAEDRAYNNIMALKKVKEENPNKIIVMCGCMPQQKQGKYNLKEKLSFVDIIIGTHNINALAQYLLKFAINKTRIYDIIDKPIASMDTDQCIRDDNINAYVNIIYGCNKFCTYCIVPYVRGREMSRQPQDIYNEVRDLVQNKGYKYITLLGQNVNSYGKDLKEPNTFSELLTYLCKIEGDFKIKFMTSHPMDFSDDLIKVMKKEDKIAKALHLPVQSGSSRILEKMNRHYDIKHYMSIIKKVKHAMPNISLSTDIIVGFPGETEKDFNMTMKLLKKVKYDQVFAFMYSKRTGTPAAQFKDQIDEKEKNKRVNKLLRLQKLIQKDQIKKYFNKTYDCLIKHINGVAVGITDGGKEIYIPNYKYVNQNYFAKVKVEDIRNHKLSGEIK